MTSSYEKWDISWNCSIPNLLILWANYNKCWEMNEGILLCSSNPIQPNPLMSSTHILSFSTNCSPFGFQACHHIQIVHNFGILWLLYLDNHISWQKLIHLKIQNTLNFLHPNFETICTSFKWPTKPWSIQY